MTETDSITLSDSAFYIGQAFGYALPATTRWWTGLTGDDLPDGFTTEILAREDNIPARTAYFRWGWRKIGKLQPYPGSPHFDALIFSLSISGTRGS